MSTEQERAYQATRRRLRQESDDEGNRRRAAIRNRAPGVSRGAASNAVTFAGAGRPNFGPGSRGPRRGTQIPATEGGGGQGRRRASAADAALVQGFLNQGGVPATGRLAANRRRQATRLANLAR